MDLITYGKQNAVITDNDIINALESACYKYGLENGLQDLKDNCNSTLFNNVILRDVGNVFKAVNALQDYNINTNIYSVDKLYILLDYYIYLCNVYDKQINYIGYTFFCGLTYNYLRDNVMNETLNAFKPQILKIINRADDMQQQTRARDSKQAILNLAYNNYRHNWNGQIKATETRTQVQSLQDIKRELYAGDGQNAILNDNDNI